MSATVPALVAPLLDPGAGRRELELPHGLTIEAIVRIALPELREEERRFLRVLLVTDRGSVALDPRQWRLIRPNPGVRVLIRIAPGDSNVLRSVLLIAVAVAAIVVAPALLGGAGILGLSLATSTALVTAGLTIAGSLLVNALIPPARPAGRGLADQERRAVYSVSGWQNDARPGEVVPCAFGRHRYAPPFAAPSYTEIVGDQQYVRGLFCFGYGRLSISDLRLGDTPLSEFDEVELEIRDGLAGDDPVSLYPRQVLEEAVNVELVRPRQRDAAGDVIEDAPAIATPVTRWSAADAVEARVIIAFNAGLFSVDPSGDLKPRTVTIRIRQRPESGGEWQDVEELNITGKKREPFFRAYSWTFPSRGRWQIEIQRLTQEATSTRISDRSTLAGIQSIRPEYPIATDKPLALVALRIKATYQLNGTVDSLNAVVQRHAPVWDGEAWSVAPSRNPASAFVEALQGPQNPFPAADAEIDWDLLADWHDWCASKGLKYDRVHDEAESLRDVLNAIAAAGRARPRHDGLKWGVVIDRPQDLVVDHLSPRNAARWRWTRTYADLPDAWRIAFRDETAGWAPAERLVPRPGFSGEPQVTEGLELPGKTDPSEIYREGRRRFYELQLRPDRITCTQDGAARHATQGDLVMASIDLLERSQAAARVTALEGRLVHLDEEVEILSGRTYALRFRVFEDEEDVIGVSVVSGLQPISVVGGRTRLFRLLLAGEDRPALGQLVHVGEALSESFALRVREIEPGRDLSSVLHLLAAAPEIDQLVEAETPPAWNGRVGAEVEVSEPVPTAPRLEILTGLSGTGDENGLHVLLSPGLASAAVVVAYTLQHRPAGASTWSEILVSIAAGGIEISSYAHGDGVELRARSIAAGGTEGGWSPIIAVEIGAADPERPAAIDDNAVIVAGGLGAIRIEVATDDPDTVAVQAYRVPAGGVLDREAHRAGAAFAISAGETSVHVLGDGTRASLVADGAFAGSGVWTAGAGWTVADGAAAHAPGETEALSQPVALSAGRTYRIAYRLSDVLAGGIAAQLAGGTPQAGVTADADGLMLDAIAAVVDNDSLALVPSLDFDGAVDDVTIYLQTLACLPAGAWDVYLEPQGVAGVAGPVSGPFSVTVI